MSSLGLGRLRITCLVSRGDGKHLAASHCFEKALSFILPSLFIYGLGIFFPLSLQKIHQLSFALWNLDEQQQQLQNRKETVNFMTSHFFRREQKWETVPENDSWGQLSLFGLAGDHQGGRCLNGTLHQSLNPVSCKAVQWYHHYGHLHFSPLLFPPSLHHWASHSLTTDDLVRPRDIPGPGTPIVAFWAPYSPLENKSVQSNNYLLRTFLLP